MKLVIATRKSPLARAQSEQAARELQARTGIEYSFHFVTTEGDRDRNRSLAQSASVGVFTREIEEALHEGKADIAIHSLKDLPIQSRIPVAAIPERQDPRDAFISPRFARFEDLPADGTLATSSPRRAAFARRFKPGLKIVNIRGNIDTRIRKIMEGEADALLIAAAGLRRLGVETPYEPLALESFPCSPGQGALAVQARSNEIAELIRPLDHAPTRSAVEGERAILAAMGGGCGLALGAILRPVDSSWRVVAAAEIDRYRSIDRTAPTVAEAVRAAIEELTRR